jgi:translation initiation factor 1
VSEKKGFASLAGLRDSLPPGPTPKEREAKKPPAWAVVRLERTGRAGKEVTVIEKLELPVEQRDVWLKELKVALGCGGAVEGVALVLQGDLRDRAMAWLTKRGVKKVTKG